MWMCLLKKEEEGLITLLCKLCSAKEDTREGETKRTDVTLAPPECNFDKRSPHNVLPNF